MKRIVGEVANALTRFAETKQWKPNDYWIYYNINANLYWMCVLLIFLSAAHR